MVVVAPRHGGGRAGRLWRGPSTPAAGARPAEARRQARRRVPYRAVESDPAIAYNIIDWSVNTRSSPA